VKQSQFSFEFNFRINFLDRTPLVSLNSSTTSRGPQASHPTRRAPTGALVPPNSASAHCRVPPTDTTCRWCPAMSPLAAATPGLLEPIPAHLFIHSTSQAKCAICFPFFRDESSELLYPPLLLSCEVCADCPLLRIPTPTRAFDVCAPPSCCSPATPHRQIHLILNFVKYVQIGPNGPITVHKFNFSKKSENM
jgi:hypothetical protein